MQQFSDLLNLSPLQRIILVSNGTLTKSLESLIDEELTVVKLHESVGTTTEVMAYLELAANQKIIQRQICLQGITTGINWLYAESIIVPDRLPPLFRHDLLDSQIPIGKLWAKHRIETFKELLPPFSEFANELAIHFHIDANATLLGRTYRVFSNQQPIMMLTEKFPAHYFINLPL